MKFCTRAGCKIQSSNPVTTGNTASRSIFKNGIFTMMKGFAFTAALLLTACIQISFAAGPISGRVIDDTGQPLPGVSVTVKGTSNGVTTNNEGRFTINVPNDTDTLVFSFVGFAVQEVGVAGRSSINITLVSDQKVLSDVVVVGYGKQKKSKSRWCGFNCVC